MIQTIKLLSVSFFLLLISCTAETLENTKVTNLDNEGEMLADSSIIAVFHESKFVSHFLDNCSQTTLELSDLNIIENILTEICNENDELKKASEYHRQYVPGLTAENHKIVWINGFCFQEDIYRDWKKGIITVKEGAPCYFYVTVDLTDGTWFDLEVDNVHRIHEKRSTTQ